jgi:hypothetical protein
MEARITVAATPCKKLGNLLSLSPIFELPLDTLPEAVG